jgi:hypothetical protein
VPREARAVSITQANRELLGTALSNAGVELGAYDRVIRDWLTDFEPAMVAVVAAWVSRSHSASFPAEMVAILVQALADAMDFRSRIMAECADCDAAELAGDPTTACARHRADHERSDRYAELSALLGAVNMIVRRPS